MKLYTEEQVYDAISKAFRYKSNIEILNSLTPIELPTDEDVEEYLNTFSYTTHLYDGQYNDGVIYGAEVGAKWMRDKILNK